MSFAVRSSISTLDGLGIVLSSVSALLSSVCLVHCLLMPFVMPVLIMLNLNIVGFESFEFWSWTMTFGLCFMVTTYQFIFKHKNVWVFIPPVIGLTLMMNKKVLGMTVEPYVGCLVGLLLVATHVLNIRMCMSCPQCNANIKKCEMVSEK